MVAAKTLEKNEDKEIIRITAPISFRPDDKLKDRMNRFLATIPDVPINSVIKAAVVHYLNHAEQHGVDRNLAPKHR